MKKNNIDEETDIFHKKIIGLILEQCFNEKVKITSDENGILYINKVESWKWLKEKGII